MFLSARIVVVQGRSRPMGEDVSRATRMGFYSRREMGQTLRY